MFMDVVLIYDYNVARDGFQNYYEDLNAESVSDNHEVHFPFLMACRLHYFSSLKATLWWLYLHCVCSTPLYLAVNLVYGSEVSKELTPLWILGPIVAALYVKMLRGICSLYVFSFMQTVRIVKNLPAYCMVVHEYLFRGKLKEAMQKYAWQPLVDIKNMDYKEAMKRKLKGFQGWLKEKYLDFVESIWPYYCRTIRFLKRANLI